MVVRPPLPVQCLNPHIREHIDSAALPAVKYQILSCQGRDILVGRIKIETPTDTGHAFILRRFDTGAISLTTMFRAAFPNASDLEERAEIQWVRDFYDLSGNNGSAKDPHITRLAGTWVSPAVALELGNSYSISELIQVIVDATPDPTGNYRRSGKAASAAAPTTATVAPATPAQAPSTGSLLSPANSTTSITPVQGSFIVSKPPSAARSLPTPSPTANLPPTKRRKESSPAPTPQSSKPPSSRGSPAPSRIAVPRRSARTKSPAPRSAATTVVRTPKVTRAAARKEAAATPGGSSELTAVEEEGQFVEDGVAGRELHDEDVREQQKLIMDLKRKRDLAQMEARAAEAAAAAQEAEELDEAPPTPAMKKREREDDGAPLQFQFNEPRQPLGERQIATNRRVGRFQMEPKTRSFAWGLAAFAVGMGAVYLPNFF